MTAHFLPTLLLALLLPAFVLSQDRERRVEQPDAPRAEAQEADRDPFGADRARERAVRDRAVRGGDRPRDDDRVREGDRAREGAIRDGDRPREVQPREGDWARDGEGRVERRVPQPDRAGDQNINREREADMFRREQERMKEQAFRERIRDQGFREGDREAAERRRMPAGVPPEAQRLIRSLQERNTALERQIREMQANVGHRERDIEAGLRERARAVAEREEQWRQYNGQTQKQFRAMMEQMEKMQAQIGELQRAANSRQGE